MRNYLMKRGGIQDGVFPCYFSSKVPTFLTLYFFSTQAPVIPPSFDLKPLPWIKSS